VENYISNAVILVPLAAGFILLLICGVAIVQNPQVSNSVAIVLAAGGLLCVAPTIAEFQGWGLKLSRKEWVAQREQSSEHGAKQNSAIQELISRVSALEKARGGSPPTPGPAENRNIVVLIFYDERKKEALDIENHLLKNGYSANVVYTNFRELAPNRRREKGESSVFFTPKTRELATKLKSELTTKFPSIKGSMERETEKLAAADIQVLLF
jgi:hypothetical protein